VKIEPTTEWAVGEAEMTDQKQREENQRQEEQKQRQQGQRQEEQRQGQEGQKQR
jgi:hypothetical protein